MKRPESNLWLPALLMGLSAMGLVGLGIRTFVVEPTIAVARARETLAGRAAEGASLAAQALLIAEGDDTTPRCRIRDGRVVEPPEGARAPTLRFVTGRDVAGEFYLRESERAERSGDLSRGLALLRVAADADRDPDLAAVARARIPALLSQRGDANAALDAVREALHTFDGNQRRTREGLLLRARLLTTLPTSTVDLIEDLTPLLGGEDDAIARGMLAEIGQLDHPRVSARDADLARIGRARVAAKEIAGENGALPIDDRLLLVRRTADETIVSEVPIPELPRGVRFEDGLTLPDAMIVERAPVAYGLFVIATTPMKPYRDQGHLRAVRWTSAATLLVAGAWYAWWQTRRAWRRERESAEARAHFLERIGHDLRTPLALIRMYAETLESGRVKDPREAREFAGIAAREAARLSGIVDDVMDLSRVATVAERAQVVDFVALVRGVVEDQAPLFAEQHRPLIAELPDHAVEVRADPDALRGAIGNLLENAWRHGAGKVSVRLGVDVGRAQLEVADEGEGVSVNDAERIFDRFARGANANGKGGGLGLALVREVSVGCGGEARYDRDRTNGAAFVMELPVVVANDAKSTSKG